MELESEDNLVERSQPLSPSNGEGLLRAANKEYLNNINYHIPTPCNLLNFFK